MDKHGIFADGAFWEEARKKALDARPASLEEAQSVVRDVLSDTPLEDALEWIRGQM